MRLSESLRRGIMESSVGGIINKFKGGRRRTTLFFEDILANYIKTCECCGHAEEFEKIGEKWCILVTRQLVPSPLKRLHPRIFFEIMKKAWSAIGILEDLSFKKNRDMVVLTVKGNTITRSVGENKFMVGCFKGILEEIMACEVKCIRFSQDVNAGEIYFFNLGAKKKVEMPCIEKKQYDRMNKMQEARGHTLKDAIRKKIFHVKGNRIFFRKKAICNSENTLFHIIGNEAIMLDKLSEISYNYFKEIIVNESTADKKIAMLKNIMQIMGWGKLTIIRTKKEIFLEINNPPFGLQNERNNWTFLTTVLLGFFWIIDRKLRIVDVTEKRKCLKVVYGMPSRNTRKSLK